MRGDATYLITGGLGGLGLSVARWMAAAGARHLVLLGRRGVRAPEQREALSALEAAGAQVVVAEADVAVRSELSRVLHEIAFRLPPLRGVVHAAGLLEDGLLLQQHMQSFARVMAPKVAGAWHLHELTSELPLDFFVMYSSSAALMGSPGQSNYVAANSFLDALAHYRRRLGLPALSINWGAFAEVGLAAYAENRGARMENRGMRSLTPAEGNELLGQLLGTDEVQVGVVPLDVRQWVEFYPGLARSSLWSELIQEGGRAQFAESGALRETLRAAAKAARVSLMENHIREVLGRVMRLDGSRIDRDAPFKSLGVDSLMGLELRNRLEASLGMKLPATLIWTYPDVARLAHQLSRLLEEGAPPQVRAEPAAVPPQPESDPMPAMLREKLLDLERLSGEELRSFAESVLS